MTPAQSPDFRLEVLEIMPHSWRLDCRREVRDLAPLHVETRRTGWAALAEIDAALDEIGFARAGEWPPGPRPDGYTAILDVPS